MAHLRLCNLDCGSISASLITPDMSLRRGPVRKLSSRLRGKGKCSAGADTLICQGGARAAHLMERRLFASGRAAARAKTPDMSTILMSPSRSGASLTVISRPSYVTLAPTSNGEPCTLLLLT